MRRMLTAWHHDRTGLFIAGLGAAVSGIGALMSRRSRLGAGILGFGLAHIALGLIDSMRD